MQSNEAMERKGEASVTELVRSPLQDCALQPRGCTLCKDYCWSTGASAHDFWIIKGWKYLHE